MWIPENVFSKNPSPDIWKTGPDLICSYHVAYTNHMKADQNDSDSLLVMLASAGCHYVMSIPQSDDVMLMYQSTSYHDIAAIREMLGLSPIEEFKQWLEGYGIWENGHLGKNAGNPRIFL